MIKDPTSITVINIRGIVLALIRSMLSDNVLQR